MTIKFNNQELIQSHRINDLNPFYDMLAPTRSNNYIDMRIVTKWADIIKQKDIPYAITKYINENGFEYVNFWVFGTELRAIRD